MKIIENINKNIAKLHKHYNVNWSLKDVPHKLLLKPHHNVKPRESMEMYNEMINAEGQKTVVKYDDFQTGSGILSDGNLLRTKIQ